MELVHECMRFGNTVGFRQSMLFAIGSLEGPSLLWQLRDLSPGIGPL